MPDQGEIDRFADQFVVHGKQTFQRAFLQGGRRMHVTDRTLEIEHGFEEFVENVGQLCHVRMIGDRIDQLHRAPARFGEVGTTNVVVEEME